MRSEVSLVEPLEDIGMNAMFHLGRTEHIAHAEVFLQTATAKKIATSTAKFGGSTGADNKDSG